MGGIIGPNYQIAAFAFAAESFPTWPSAADNVVPIPGGRELYAEADAGALLGNPPPPIPQLSATANANVNQFYRSTGPVRPGFIEFSISLGYEHGLPGDVSIGGYNTDSLTSTTGCTINGCLYNGTLPFELGTTFQASASSSTGSNGLSGGSDIQSAAVFQLLEANGTTPVTTTPVVVPEPSTLSLFGLGLLLGGALLARKKNLLSGAQA